MISHSHRFLILLILISGLMNYLVSSRLKSLISPSSIYFGYVLTTFFGRLPSEICLLTHLKVLFLHSNNLNGPIPPSLGNLNNLVKLFLLDNSLSSSIPPNIGNLRSLLELDLSINQLSGSIPPSVGNLSSLI